MNDLFFKVEHNELQIFRDHVALRSGWKIGMYGKGGGGILNVVYI